MKHLCAFCLCFISIITSGQEVDSITLRQVDSLIDISRIYTERQHFNEAFQAAALARGKALEVFGKESVPYANCQFNYGRIFYKTGQYEKAEPCYLDTKNIREKIWGKENRDFARCLNNLAVLYKEMGEYESAERYYLEVKTIQEKVLGKGDPDYLGTLGNLANLYSIMGRFESAEQYYLEVIAVREKSLGKEQRAYALSLNNFAILCFNRARYDLAEPLYLKAKNIREKELGKEDPVYAGSLNNLALLYVEIGKYSEAESLFVAATTIWEKKLGKRHSQFAEGLNNLGILYQRIGNYDLAESYFRETVSLREQVLGKTHPDYAVSLNNLANLYGEMGRFKDAAALYQEANTITNALLSNSSRYLSDRELSAYAQLFTKDLDRYYSFVQMNRRKLVGFSASCYDNALFHKGFLLNASSRVSNLAASDTVATKLNNRMKSYHRRLAREYAKPVVEREGVAELESQANLTEKELRHNVTGFSEAIQNVKWKEVQAALVPGEAAIEFIHYRYYSPFRTDSILYTALILKPGDAEPQLVPLFEERQLERLLPKSNDMDRIDDFYKTSTGKLVFDLVWQPLDDLLVGINKVYCSPSGLLHRINLGAIPVASATEGHGGTFANRHHLVLLGSTRQLVSQIAGVQQASMQAVLFGGINYEVDTTVVGKTPVRDSVGVELPVFERALTPIPFFFDTTSQTWVTKKWKPLPGTETEVRHIAGQLLNHGFSAQLYTQSAATEESFKQIGRMEFLTSGQASSPRILHLATHGYFFPDPATNPNGGDETSFVFKSSKQPMIRSGLILAGANTAWVTRYSPAELEDGILTAYEISQQNLSNTELVVLSACETGLGHIEGNEGVYGLQRAFKIAGAKYLIMSLWQVNDQKTRELMVEFYHQYLDQKLPVPEAFRLAQQAMRAKYPGSPYVWAAFVLIE